VHDVHAFFSLGRGRDRHGSLELVDAWHDGGHVGLGVVEEGVAKLVDAEDPTVADAGAHEAAVLELVVLSHDIYKPPDHPIDLAIQTPPTS
jgi:hypothetical protein